MVGLTQYNAIVAGGQCKPIYALQKNVKIENKNISAWNVLWKTLSMFTKEFLFSKRFKIE